MALLSELFRDLTPDRDIVIIGENDQKPDGNFPGCHGAVTVATKLVAMLGRPVKWALPPDGAKDVRDWLTDPARGTKPWADRGAELAAKLLATAVTISPPDDPPAAPSPGDGPNDGPDDPHRLAAGFLATVSRPGESRRLRFWKGDFVEWRDGADHVVFDDDLRGRVTTWVRAEFGRQNAAEVAAWRAANAIGKGKPPETRKVSTRLVGDVLQALKGLCLLPEDSGPPAWLDGASGPDPSAVLPVRNGLLDLDAAAAGRGDCLLPPSASIFTFNAAPFEYAPDAPEPRAWLKFLADLWPDDTESVACLQEWFGYFLTPDTSQQKILFLPGPKRSGKGAICLVLRELVGTGNVAGPTLGGLATNFGLSPLLGKSVAVVSDARLSNRADAATIVDRCCRSAGRTP